MNDNHQVVSDAELAQEYLSEDIVDSIHEFGLAGSVLLRLSQLFITVEYISEGEISDEPKIKKFRKRFTARTEAVGCTIIISLSVLIVGIPLYFIIDWLMK